MKVIRKAGVLLLLCGATMSYLTPDIQNALFQAARRQPARYLFTGEDRKAKTLAAEILAAHFEAYLFPVALAPLLSPWTTDAAPGLQRIFSRAATGGDLLFFEGGDLAGCAAEAVAFFLQQVKDYRGVVILCVSEDCEPLHTDCFDAVIRFPTGEEGNRSC